MIKLVKWLKWAECYKLKFILTLPYFEPESAVYKTRNLRILAEL